MYKIYKDLHDLLMDDDECRISFKTSGSGTAYRSSAE